MVFVVLFFNKSVFVLISVKDEGFLKMFQRVIGRRLTYIGDLSANKYQQMGIYDRFTYLLLCIVHLKYSW